MRAELKCRCLASVWSVWVGPERDDVIHLDAAHLEDGRIVTTPPISPPGRPLWCEACGELVHRDPPPSTLSAWQRAAHRLAVEKGWWDRERELPEVIALAHSELSEALEAYRDGAPAWVPGGPGKPEGVGPELADVVIRVLDYCEHAGIDLQRCMEAKHAYNANRPHRHGGKRA